MARGRLFDFSNSFALANTPLAVNRRKAHAQGRTCMCSWADSTSWLCLDWEHQLCLRCCVFYDHSCRRCHGKVWVSMVVILVLGQINATQLPGRPEVRMEVDFVLFTPERLPGLHEEQSGWLIDTQRTTHSI